MRYFCNQLVRLLYLVRMVHLFPMAGYIMYAPIGLGHFNLCGNMNEIIFWEVILHGQWREEVWI